MNVQTEIEKRKDQIKQLQAEIYDLQFDNRDKIIKQNEDEYVGKCVELSSDEYLIVKSVSDDTLYGISVDLTDDDIYIADCDSDKIDRVKRVISKDEFMALQDKIITRACQLLSVK